MSAIETVGEFEMQPDRLKNDLTFCRRLRDSLAESLNQDAQLFGDEDQTGEQKIEAICYNDFDGADFYMLEITAPDWCIEELRLLRHISRRIAAIERRKCRAHVERVFGRLMRQIAKF